MTRNRHDSQVKPFKDIAKEIEKRVPANVKHTHYSGGKEIDHNVKLQIRSQQIAIGLPLDELMFSQFMVNLLGLNLMPWDAVITTSSTYLPEARNKIHNLFLDNAGPTHLFMLDSDVLPPPDFIARMLNHDKAVVGGWYRKKEKFPVKDESGGVITIQRPCVYDYSGNKNGTDQFSTRIYPGNGMERVDGAGAGCWLMRRDAAEVIGRSPYSMETSGEDFTLCLKLKKAGIPIYVDWDTPCAHLGTFFV